MKNNPNQLCWLIRKVRQSSVEQENEDDEAAQEFQLHFLDHHSYSERCIRRYERIHGQDFLTNGGLDHTKASDRMAGIGY